MESRAALKLFSSSEVQRINDRSNGKEADVVLENSLESITPSTYIIR